MLWGLTSLGQVGLKGTVKDFEDREPLPYAHLTLERDGAIPYEAFADFDGRFEIKSIKPGTYMLYLKYAGYETFSKKFIISHTKGYYIENVELLKSKKSAEFDTIVIDTLRIQTYEVADIGLKRILDFVIDQTEEWSEYKNAIMVLGHELNYKEDDLKSDSNFFIDYEAIGLSDGDKPFAPQDIHEVYDITFTAWLQDWNDLERLWGCIKYRDRLILLIRPISPTLVRPTEDGLVEYLRGIGRNLIKLWDPRSYLFKHQGGHWYYMQYKHS